MRARVLLAVTLLAACHHRAPAAVVPLAPAATVTEDRPTVDRVEFAAALARVQPGMTDVEVRAILGAPGDVRTERDPGGIAAARTVEVWRYGTNGHLTFGTLGTVHIQADRTVQYVFGGRGTPPAAGTFGERELRALLRALDAVPSYDDPTPDPLPIIRAVNALQPLGKDQAIAAIDEYLRVSSWLDDSGRDGTFLVLRTLFDVPDDPGYLPVMMVGAPVPAPPADPRALPRFPIALVDDIPLRVVSGYMLAGAAQPPEDHLAWFRRHGTLRARPLTPPATPLATLDKLAGASGTVFLTTAHLDDDNGRRFLLAQGLRLVATAIADDVAPGVPLDDEWHRVLAAQAARPLSWDAAANRYTLADGTVLAITPARVYQRELWTPAVAGATVKIILERQSPDEVDVELRIDLAPSAILPKARLRLLAADGAELRAFDIAPMTAPPS